jgi:hypothetical protein
VSLFISIWALDQNQASQFVIYDATYFKSQQRRLLCASPLEQQDRLKGLIDPLCKGGNEELKSPGEGAW